MIKRLFITIGIIAGIIISIVISILIYNNLNFFYKWSDNQFVNGLGIFLTWLLFNLAIIIFGCIDYGLGSLVAWIKEGEYYDSQFLLLEFVFKIPEKYENIINNIKNNNEMKKQLGIKKKKQNGELSLHQYKTYK